MKNASSEEEVDRIMAYAKTAGATITKNAQKVFWGGYCGYITDPEGHIWEVPFKSFMLIDAHGPIQLP